MYAIYANIWGIFMVNVTIYSSTMDPMGNIIPEQIINQQGFRTLLMWIYPTTHKISPARSW